VDFTVIISTYNRCRNLPRCLDALERQSGVDGLAWEVLVVDNNSTDDTRNVVESFAARSSMHLRYAFEPEQGLSNARNRGVRESSAPLYAFIDDDIAASPGWLAAFHRTFLIHDADAVGGRIHLDPSLSLPRWVDAHAELKGFLGYQDFGDEPFQMDGLRRYPFGGNMAFHRRVSERIGHFDPRLGRKGLGSRRSELFKGEEGDYFRRLTEAAGRIFYAPEAIVFHRVEPFQLKKRYFRTIHFNAGYQKGLDDGRTFARSLFGVPLFMFSHLARGGARYLRQLLTQGPDRAFRQQMNLGHTVGMMAGYARRSTPS
jgi:glycosyltransferase involved in cell wall biosynthesis